MEAEPIHLAAYTNAHVRSKGTGELVHCSPLPLFYNLSVFVSMKQIIQQYLNLVLRGNAIVKTDRL